MNDEHGQVPTGNTYDKYGSKNPIVRMMMRGFDAAMVELLDRAAPREVLDVGCGEGIQTERCAHHLGQVPFMGVDLNDPKLAAHWETRSRPGLAFRDAQADRLPFDDQAFDLVMSLEMLEHVEDPDKALAEMSRVARQWVLISVPREPLWRALNLMRGAYVGDLGNTPGHIQHWSLRTFKRLAARYGTIEEVRSPIPWSMILLRINR
jgi:ubiquinone/menaquinone biosynthesis C-methylase UbiE